MTLDQRPEQILPTVQFLPVVERELRVAAHHSRTWWRRTLTLVAALVIVTLTWVESRDHLQERVLAVLIWGGALFCAVKHARSPLTWPTEEVFIVWAAITHYLLCLWICVQAPRRFADDKQSGALELLLCTTMPVAYIVKGTLWALWRRFGRAVVALVLLDAFLVHAHVSGHGGWSNYSGNGLLLLCVLAAIVFPIQGYTFAYVGLYQGLAKTNSLRATFTLIWTLGLLPWAVFIGFVMACDIGRRYFPFLPRTTEQVAFTSWAGVHLAICVLIAAELPDRVEHRQHILNGGFRENIIMAGRRYIAAAPLHRFDDLPRSFTDQVRRAHYQYVV